MASESRLSLDSLLEDLALPANALLAKLQRERFQGSGPGGQHRNRTLSAVRLRHPESGLQAEAASHREGGRNLHEALHRLRIALALLAAEQFRSAQKGGEADAAFLRQTQERFRPFRMPINADHDDFPGQCFLSLSWLSLCDAEPKPAAAELRLSPSALTRFFKLEGSLWQMAQRIRSQAGRGQLR
ncbi:MAG: peptide chain release factor-like protein [Leptospirales bacterium]|nr:peptide chain release factor-like protein [Leptospirales bacterium]